MRSCCTAPCIDPSANPCSPGGSPPAVPWRSWRGLSAIASCLRAWPRRDAAHRLLVRLDERMLRDVGLSEADLPRAVQHERRERDSAVWRLLGPNRFGS
ncbi:DUF1127 domain-containing protein [Rubrivivax sp. RP6-9]|uniref:DUF1127 domain-containing protein n=1 Tax=Rubrivivax sp. RP6-9 TaxID=3415750 RepID=UPI003CC5B637